MTHTFLCRPPSFGWVRVGSMPSKISTYHKIGSDAAVAAVDTATGLSFAAFLLSQAARGTNMLISTNYLVELKDTVFEDTPLIEDEFSDDRQIEFPSETAAQEWVSEKNQLHNNLSEIIFHAVHSHDTSDVDAYMVFQPQGRWGPD